MESFITGDTAFPQFILEPAVISLNQNMKQLSGLRTKIFAQIAESNNMHLFGFKQFENLVAHSLQQTNFKINIHSGVLFKLLLLFIQNKDKVALCKPISEDQLFQKILKLKKKVVKNMDC